jgi:hypothetical protein
MKRKLLRFYIHLKTLGGDVDFLNQLKICIVAIFTLFNSCYYWLYKTSRINCFHKNFFKSDFVSLGKNFKLLFHHSPIEWVLIPRPPFLKF